MMPPDKDKLNLLELCLSPNKGGLELYYADISNKLSPHFHVVNVVAENSAVAPLLAANRPVLRLRKKANYFPLISAKKLAKIIDELQIDIMHLHWNSDLTLAVFAKLFSKSKPKIVLTRHMKFPSRKDGFFHKFLYKNIDHIFAITQTMANDLKRFIPEEVRPSISVNYLGTEEIAPVSKQVMAERRLAYDPENNRFLIALVGRIDFDKGHEFLLDALKIAKAKGLPFKALIVGHAMTDEYLLSLKAKIKQFGLEDYMVFTGFVDKPRALMQACDTVILTTIEETFGLVLIEAMSIGVPVIGSNRGGVPEIIEHGQTGLLFESMDSQALFDALYTIYENPEQARGFAEKALKTVGMKFNAQHHLETLVQGLDTVGRG